MEVRLASGPEEVGQALRLRERVFCGEQGVDPLVERDGRDPDALHVVAVEDDRVVGTCRLVLHHDVAFLGRLAVERELRRRGIGAAVLREAERAARQQGASRIALHAQLAARSLYSGDGYVERGEPFVEAGIDHVAMEKALA
jgi:predicted GNAT family N-acyltransferase